jgi:hypothetical protein
LGSFCLAILFDRMKKSRFCLIEITLIVTFGLLLSGCDLSSGKQPINQPETRWINEAYDICFFVDSEKHCYGEMVVNGKTTKIAVCFLNGNEVQIMPLDAVENVDVIVDKRKLWQGYAKFSKTEMTLYEATYNELFPDDNMEITFVRQGEPEEVLVGG